VEQFAGNLRASRCVAIRDGHADQVEVRRLHRKPDRPRVVDIAANVRVQNDVQRPLLRRRGQGMSEKHEARGQEARSPEKRAAG
jgi:hypothetical protein